MNQSVEAPLRLVFVYPQLKRLTGAQRLILQLATALVEQGHQLTLVTHRLADECRAVLAPAVVVIETGQRVDLTGRHLLDSASEYLFGMALTGRRPVDRDATVFFGPPSLPALAWARRQSGARLPPEPLLSFCYEPPRFAYADRHLIAARFGPMAPAAAWTMRLYRPIDRWLIGRADLVLANSRFGASEIREAYGLPALVIDHGVALAPVDQTAIDAINARFGLGEMPVMLTVNHLHPRKRLDLFLAVLARLRSAGTPVVGLIAGDGADRARLQGIAADLRVNDCLRWAGFVPESELLALYQRAQVYLHTGQRETFGLSVLEAAAAGCPVVAVDEGGPRDILEAGRLGVLAPADPEALARAVTDLLGDPARARQLGDLAATAVKSRYRWEHGAAMLASAIRLLRAGRSAQTVVSELQAI